MQIERPGRASARDLARDTRSGKEGEVMAKPGEGGPDRFWLRPEGGGCEWDVPSKYVEIIRQHSTAPAGQSAAD